MEVCRVETSISLIEERKNGDGEVGGSVLSEEWMELGRTWVAAVSKISLEDSPLGNAHIGIEGLIPAHFARGFLFSIYPTRPFSNSGFHSVILNLTKEN